MPAEAPAGPGPLRCLAVFTDGAFAFGTLNRGAPEDWVLALDPHRTGAGTAITAKRWRLAFRTEGGTTLYRVQARF